MEHTQVPAGSIVVGVDGSSTSDKALDWAVRQADLEHRPLVILHAVQVPGMSQLAWFDAPGRDQTRLAEDLRTSGRELLGDAAVRAHRSVRDLEVHEVLASADPRVALMSQAADAATVVIGSRGRGPVTSLLLGSVSVAVSKHAECPVVVVRPHDAHIAREGVLVGVDGTALDRPVVEFAFRMASLRSLPLTVVHSFWDADHAGREEHDVAHDEPGLEDKRTLLSHAVSGMEGKFPEVSHRLELSRGFADRRLITGSQVMDLVVVGCRHPGELQDLVFGSFASTVVEHAACAVAVVPMATSA